MGCIWSYQESGLRHCSDDEEFRQAINSISATQRAAGPCYGEYRCRYCNRYWTSRYCRPNKYQLCQRCHIRVYAHAHRPLDSNDFDSSQENKEHKKELCQMCRELGHLCTRDRPIPKRSKFNF